MITIRGGLKGIKPHQSYSELTKIINILPTNFQQFYRNKKNINYIN